MASKKRKRKTTERPTIHPRNKYSENPPDFSLLASLYPSFTPFVFYSKHGHPKIDWADFNATRELTRILLYHDHGLNWWIPDGQLCPTVPNRSNYIHWIEDLLSSDVIPNINTDRDYVRGFDIGTGANCIYPLLGASLLGWHFVGSDVTDVALEWAELNVKSNPHIAGLIEIRKADSNEILDDTGLISGEREAVLDENSVKDSDLMPPPSLNGVFQSEDNDRYSGPPVLVGLVRENEKFDFCMCNPPFFENMEKAGLNPKTACGGTPEEMVCPGGEKAFITRIIEDSVVLNQSFRWYTSMVGRKSNLKFLMSKLRELGVTIVKTTEFVQGQTCRWGLAWSFVPPAKKIVAPPLPGKNALSFMLEGVQRQFSAIDVLQSVESFFSAAGASCKSSSFSFTVHITASSDLLNELLKSEVEALDEDSSSRRHLQGEPNSSESSVPPMSNLSFTIYIFQQNVGTLLVKATIHDDPSSDLIHTVWITLILFVFISVPIVLYKLKSDVQIIC